CPEPRHSDECPIGTDDGIPTLPNRSLNADLRGRGPDDDRPDVGGYAPKQFEAGDRYHPGGHAARRQQSARTASAHTRNPLPTHPSSPTRRSSDLCPEPLHSDECPIGTDDGIPTLPNRSLNADLRGRGPDDDRPDVGGYAPKQFEAGYRYHPGGDAARRQQSA